MKVNKLFLSVLGIAAVLGLQAFDLKESESKLVDPTDSVKTKQLVKAVENSAVPAADPNLTGKLFDQPVAFRYVKPCLEAYVKSGGQVSGVTLTQSVTFERKDLLKWLNTLHEQTDFTQVQVSMGLYTPEFLEHYRVPNADKLVNRLTVFLVAYCNGVPARYKPGKGPHKGSGDDPEPPVDSFNLGNVHP